MVAVGPGRAVGRRTAVGLVMVTAALAACGSGARSPACNGYDALIDALRAVELAKSADASDDSAEVGRQMEQVDRFVGVARRRLAGAEADPNTGSAARAMLEAANYLSFMVGDFRATGAVDYSMTQFASRELNRASAGAGGAPLNC